MADAPQPAAAPAPATPAHEAAALAQRELAAHVRRTVRQMARFFKEKRPANVLAHANEQTKHPHEPYKGGLWTSDKFDAQYARYPCWPTIVLLIRDMVVIDADSPASKADLEARFPILHHVPMETTRKGAHYFFLRSRFCDEEGYYGSVDRDRKMDFLTISNSEHSGVRTPGVCCIAPSANKAWVRPIWEAESWPLVDVPDEVVLYVHKGAKDRPAHLPAEAVAEPTAAELVLVAGGVRPTWMTSTTFADLALLARNIPPASINHYDDWVRTGLAFANAVVDNGLPAEAMLQLFRLASREWPDFIPDACDDKARELLRAAQVASVTRRVAVGTLVWLVRNGKHAQRYRHDTALWAMTRSLCGDATLGAIFHDLCGADLVCVNDGKPRRWRRYDEASGLWMPDNDDGALQHIAEVALPAVADLQSFVASDMTYERIADAEAKPLRDAAKFLAGLCRKVEDGRGMPAVLNVCSRRFRNVDFEKCLNTQPDMLPVKNGIIDLRTLTLRPREREDLVATTTGVDYVPAKPAGAGEDEAGLDVGWLRKAVLDIFSDDADLMEAAMPYFGVAVTGERNLDKFLCVVGEGCNGKSVLQLMMESALGPFYAAVDSKVLYGTDRLGDTGVLVGARCVAASETTEPLSNEAVKKMTGGDSILTRRLYHDPVKTLPTWKMQMYCNRLPNFKDDVLQDSAFERRLRVVRTRTTFHMTAEALRKAIDEEGGSGHFHKLGDPGLKDRIAAEPEAALNLLVDYAHKGFYDRGMKLPEPHARMAEWAEAYRTRDDELGEWLEAHYRVDPTKSNDKAYWLRTTYLHMHIDSYMDTQISGRARPFTLAQARTRLTRTLVMDRKRFEPGSNLEQVIRGVIRLTVPTEYEMAKRESHARGVRVDPAAAAELAAP
jgi:P4 family phage/plasmid primase-like protien